MKSNNKFFDALKRAWEMSDVNTSAADAEITGLSARMSM